MGWKDKIEDIVFEITTGDGEVYTPLWKDAKKNIKFNAEGFDFVGVEGTYVNRKKKSGNQYPLLFYFQGDDCIEQAEAFEQSTRDSRQWSLKHPFFGTLKVQPLSLNFDYTSYNSVKITGTVWETISKKYPKSVTDQSSEVQEQKSSIDSNTEDLFVESTVETTSENIQSSLSSSLITGDKYDVLIDNDSDAAVLRDLISQASGAAQNILSAPTIYIQQAIALINFPFVIEESIKTKINVMIEAIQSLVDIFLTDNDNDKDREIYELQSSVMLSELCRNAVDSDFDKVSDVFDAIEDIFDIYTEVNTNMDDINYVQNSELAQQTDLIVNTTIATLFDVAFDSKQERSVIINYNDNMITLAHKYYGPGDDNLIEFIENNNIGITEYLEIKKGREIIYFV